VHFIDGAAGVDAIPLDVLIGPCEVVEAHDLSRDSVAAAPAVERILFKTPNSELWAIDEFADEFVSLDGAAAELLVERGVRLVGVDYLSVDYLSVGDENAHHTLLEAGVVPVEGLDLRRSRRAATSWSACRSASSPPMEPRRARDPDPPLTVPATSGV